MHYFVAVDTLNVNLYSMVLTHSLIPYDNQAAVVTNCGNASLSGAALWSTTRASLSTRGLTLARNQQYTPGGGILLGANDVFQQAQIASSDDGADFGLGVQRGRRADRW